MDDAIRIKDYLGDRYLQMMERTSTTEQELARFLYVARGVPADVTRLAILLVEAGLPVCEVM